MSKKIIVIKIGSSVLLDKTNKLSSFRISRLALQTAAIRNAGIIPIFVVSGAVACGMESTKLSLESSLEKTIAAGIGQSILTASFERIFKKNGLVIAQVLLTKKDLISQGKHHLRTILLAYIKMGVIPVINENDIVKLNNFGGNDYLALKIAELIKAQKLLFLSTMQGSIFGVGGGKSKLNALKKAKKIGINSLIVNGKLKNILLKTI